METVDKFLTRMYRTNPDFVFTVTRESVRDIGKYWLELNHTQSD